MVFKDRIFPQYLQKCLNDLRTCGLHDVTILVDDKEFTAHKCVLSAASPYFRTMFNPGGSFRESSQDKITLHDVDPDAVSAILNYIYTSSINITEKNVYPLMETCSMMQIHGLRAWIGHYLRNTMTTDNCLSLYINSSLYNYYDLAQSTMHFILLNFSQVAEGDEFLQTPLKVLIEVLSSKLLNVDNENSLLKYVLKWVKADVQARKDHVEELLKRIRVENVSLQTLLDFKNDPLYGLLQDKVKDFINEEIVTKYEEKRSNYTSREERWDTIRHHSEQGIILAIGGESYGDASKGVECFTPGYDSWKYVIPQYVTSDAGPINMVAIPAMTCARYNAAVANDSYKVYVLGGRNSSNYLSECETYDVRKNRWKNLTDLPCKLEGSGAVIFEGRLIVIGGRNENGCTNEAWVWNEKHQTWRSFPPLTSPRSFHGALAVAGFIFVLGGFDSDEEVALRTGERFDPNLNEWCEIRCMHQARARFGSAVIRNEIYVIGGINENIGLRTVERYDVERNEWFCMASLSVPRYSFSVAVWEQKIYCIGGSDTIHRLNNVEKFNPRTNRWHYFISMHVSRFGSASATLLIPYFNFPVLPVT